MSGRQIRRRRRRLRPRLPASPAQPVPASGCDRGCIATPTCRAAHPGFAGARAAPVTAPCSLGAGSVCVGCPGRACSTLGHPAATANPKPRPPSRRRRPPTPTIINAPGSSAAKVADYEERPQPSLEVKITKPASPDHADVAQPHAAEAAPPAPVLDAITPPAPVPAEPPRATAEVTEAAKPEPGGRDDRGRRP